MIRFTRRTFIQSLLGAAAIPLGAWWYSRDKGTGIPGGILGARRDIGHMLRSARLGSSHSEEAKTIVIVGGGIAGLSAAWWLERNGISDFVLLELEERVGGNSQSGENSISSYPWGAHYVPVPNRESVLVAELFKEIGVIVGIEKGAPVYSEEYLCQSPQERLYIHGRWQEGLVPHVGNSNLDDQQFAKFLSMMRDFSNLTGRDSKPAFAIPIDLSSGDSDLIALDRQTMASWLDTNGFTSLPLRWYIDYCCRDDYGCKSEHVSAWAGIHYFASRRPWLSQQQGEIEELLTWPNGNGWIVDKLRSRLNKYIVTGALVTNIKQSNVGQQVSYFRVLDQTIRTIAAKNVIYAAPRFTAAYVIDGFKTLGEALQQEPEYNPWLVANLTLSNRFENSPRGLAWDNVIYASDSLGYVNATHQIPGYLDRRTVISYYRPLDRMEPKQAREWAMQQSAGDWKRLVVDDLSAAHGDILNVVENIDIWLWGHAMVRPKPGYIWDPQRREAMKEYPGIYFAHSDMSGISIFEEAQYRGVEAAKSVMSSLAA